jgi:acetoin utilization protein AcuB
MYVGRVMHKDLVTVEPATTIVEADKILTDKQIAHLLVVNEAGKLLGIISDRDLKKSWASPATTLTKHELNYLLSQLTVDMIMIRKIITIAPDTTIERAAQIMQENRINALPVKDGEKLVGIITSRDVMEVLLEAIGIDGDSRRFTVIVADRVGTMADLSNLLKEEQINIRSIFAWPDKDQSGIYHLVIRVSARDGDRAVGVLQGGGYKVLTEYVKDISAYLPDK